jgi:putative peptidoglycan lipid II flippase
MTPWLAESLSTQSALLRRAAALGALCCGGGLVYAAAGRLLGAFRLRELGRLGKPL